MSDEKELRLTATVKGSGWASKLAPGDLDRALCGLEFPADPNLIVGLDKADDAGVYKITDDIAIIQTVDFFTPIVDDPYWFGQIAAANALSDVYAMGGEPKTAMNLIGFPVNQMDISVLRRILQGGLEKIKEKSLAIHQQVETNYKDYAKIYYYRSSSPEYALKFGNDLSRSYHSGKLQGIYKNVYFYDIWTKRFANFDYNRRVPFEKIRSRHGDKIVFQGTRGVKVPGVKLKEISGIRFKEGLFLPWPWK